jgi:hypothetical protein
MCLSHWNQMPSAWKLGMRFLKLWTTIFRSQCCRGYGNILQLCVFWNIPCHSTWSRFVFYISLFSIDYKWHAFVSHQDIHCEERQLPQRHWHLLQVFVVPVLCPWWYLQEKWDNFNDVYVLWPEHYINNISLCSCVQVLNLPQSSDSGTALSHLLRFLSWS